MSIRTIFALAAAASLALLACGEDPNGNGNGNGGNGNGEPPTCEHEYMVDVSGTVYAHPIDPETVVDGADFVLENADRVLAGNPDSSVKFADCEPAETVLSAGATPNEAPFSFESVNTGVISLTGLVATVSGDGLVTTTTGLAGAPVRDDVHGGSAYALSLSAEAILAPLLEDSDGNPYAPGELAADGFFVVRLLDPDDDPIEGAILTRQQGSDWVDVVNVVYPNEDLSGTLDATGPTGLIIAGRSALRTYSARAEGWTFNNQQAAALEGRAFVMQLYGTPVDDD